MKTKTYDKPVAPFVRSPYNYNTNQVSDDTALDCSRDPSKTKQSFTEEADINTIVRRFALTGELPQNVRLPQYGDFTNIGTYHDALNAIAIANESFYAMPAQVRARFDNDPDKFVAFCLDDNNRAEAEKLGLVPTKIDGTEGKAPGDTREPKTVLAAPQKPRKPGKEEEKTDT